MNRLPIAEISRRRSMTCHQSPGLIAVAEVVATLAHELNSPLSVIAGQASLIQEMVGDDRIAGRAGKILQAAQRSSGILKAALALAVQDPVELTSLDLNELVPDGLEDQCQALRAANIEVTSDLAKHLPSVRGNATLLAQVMTNLLVNARQAMEAITEPRQLRVSSAFDTKQQQVVVIVQDSGLGVAAAIRSRIFDPFVTSKEIGAGTGLGLALCKRIVEGHLGTIELEPGHGRGAAFAIRLPVERVEGRELAPAALGSSCSKT